MRNMMIILLVLLATVLSPVDIRANEQALDNRIGPPVQVFPGFKVTKDSLIRQYLEQRGYTMVSEEGKVFSYKLSKDILVTYPGTVEWGVQSFDPKPYIDEVIQFRKFIVTNHPLDKYSTEGKTEVHLFLWNDIPIGGTSLPYSKQTLLGGVYSVDGRTFEQVQEIRNYSLEYPAWAKKWRQRFE